MCNSRCRDNARLPAMVEIKNQKHDSADGREVVKGDDKKKTVAVAGVVIAAAAAAVALGRHLLHERKFKSMSVFVLKADNGTEAHIRPLGCCIQRMLLPAFLASAGLDSYDIYLLPCAGLLVPDADGTLEDVVLGFDDMKAYQVDLLQIANKMLSYSSYIAPHLVSIPVM